MNNNKKTVLITGASRGIGASIALKFASLDYNIIVNYLNSDERAIELKNNILKKYNVDVLLLKADLSIEEEINKMFDIIDKNGIKIDVLINNAGIADDCLVEDKTKDSFNKIIDVNLIAPFLLCQRVKKYMEKGSIINITSTNGIDTYYPYGMDYDASKAGLISLTKNFAKYYAPNIRVNAVACGWVNTEMNKNMDQELINQEKGKSLLKRFANPDEIASVVAFLASDDASYINSEIIRVDGGYNG